MSSSEGKQRDKRNLLGFRVDLQQFTTKELHLLKKKVDVVAAANNKVGEIESDVGHNIGGVGSVGIVHPEAGDALADVLDKLSEEREARCAKR